MDRKLTMIAIALAGLALACADELPPVGAAPAPRPLLVVAGQSNGVALDGYLGDVNGAKGGTGLVTPRGTMSRAHWSRSGPGWPRLVSRLEGERVRAVLWVQGERDVTGCADPEAYRRGLELVADRAERHLGGAPLVVGLTGSPAGHPCLEPIRAAQRATWDHPNVLPGIDLAEVPRTDDLHHEPAAMALAWRSRLAELGL